MLQRLVREAPEQPAPRADDGPPVRTGPSEPLTSRELEVLERMTLGHTNTGIAQDLTISVGTVKAYVQRVISKLGVSDRTQAAVRAVELQIVRPAS